MFFGFSSVYLFSAFLVLVSSLIWNSFFVKNDACLQGKPLLEARYEECKTYTGQERDSCYFGVVGISEWIDPLICDQISDNSQYKAVCYSMMAERTKDVLLCEKIQDQFMMNGLLYSNQQTREQCFNKFEPK